MAKVSLSLETLGDLDSGTAKAIIDREIAAAVEDIDDRGEDGKERTVSIKLRLKRIDNGTVMAHVEAAASLPSRRSYGTAAEVQVRSGGGANGSGKPVLSFQSMNPERPDQPTFPKLDERDQE